MILNVFLEDQTYPIEIPDYIVTEAEDFFSILDNDMNKGWQMSQIWVESPDTHQRCQIVADKLLTALTNDDQKTGLPPASLPGHSSVPCADNQDPGKRFPRRYDSCV